jgi:hypothetical protein
MSPYLGADSRPESRETYSPDRAGIRARIGSFFASFPLPGGHLGAGASPPYI